MPRYATETKVGANYYFDTAFWDTARKLQDAFGESVGLSMNYMFGGWLTVSGRNKRKLQQAIRYMRRVGWIDRDERDELLADIAPAGD